jgi:MFS family permease
MIIGKLFFGGLGDRLDHRLLYWVSMSLLCCAYVALLVTDSYEGLFVGVICMGLAGGGILPLLGVIFGARFGVASFGRVMGLVGVVMMFGALAPIIFGWVYDVQGTYDMALVSLLAVAVPAMIAMFWLPQPSVSAPD